MVDALAEWATIAGPSVDLSRLSGLRADAFTAFLNGEEGNDVVAVFRDGEQLLYPLAPGFVAQDALFVGDDAVFAAADENRHEFYLYLWDGQAEAPEVLLESKGDDWFWSEYAVAGTSLYYNIRRDSTTCIEVMDLSRSTPRQQATEVTCGARGQDLGWLFVSDSVPSFLSARPGDACETLYRVVSPEAGAELVEGTTCVSRGVANADLAAWTEPPEPDSAGATNLFDVAIRALADGVLYDLGRSTTGSPTICDGTLYWTKEADFAAGAPAEIRRWHPGGPIEVIYRSPDENPLHSYATSRPTCTGHTIAIQRLGWWANAGEEILTTPPLDWTADLKPAAPRPPD